MLKASFHRRETRRMDKRLGRQQSGMMIIEAMVAIMIVLLGILGIAGLLAKSTALAGQAQYRTEAGMYAEQIVQMISLSVDRSSDANLATSLQGFQHQAAGTKQCDFSGDSISETSATGQLLKAARGGLANVAGLPGALSAGQQVKVETTNNINKITVTLCWKAPADGATRNYQIQAFVH